MVNVYRKPKLKTFHYVFIGRSRVKNIIHLQYIIFGDGNKFWRINPNIIFFYLITEYYDGVWLGFNDLQNEGQFIAMSDAKEPLYTNWGSTEPNNGLLKDEHCVMYWPKYKCWNDSNCTSRLNYVCKKSPK